MKKLGLHYWFALKIWQQIIIALILGIIAGFLLGHKAIYLKPVGALFINAIHMLIIPVVFTAITCAVISINDPQKMNRIALKVILVYAVSMIIAASIGVGIATIISPGIALHLTPTETLVQLHTLPPFNEIFTNLIPANPLNAFLQENIIQILVFAIFLGVAINLAGEHGKPVAALFKSFSVVSFKLTGIVMKFAPYGVFALMAWVTGDFGLSILVSLFKMVATVYLSCFSLILLFSFILLTFLRQNPVSFFKGIANAMSFAFASCSSAATLPITMKCAEENLGISPGVARFLLPLGTTLNLNGLSMYLAVVAIFAANVYGIHLSWGQYITIILTIVISSMGAGGIPGSAIIIMGAVLSSVNLPLGVISLIAGVDRLNDMAQTTTNVIGDVFATLVIAKNENELDPVIYEKNAVKTVEPEILRVSDEKS